MAFFQDQFPELILLSKTPCGSAFPNMLWVLLTAAPHALTVQFLCVPFGRGNKWTVAVIWLLQSLHQEFPVVHHTGPILKPIYQQLFR